MDAFRLESYKPSGAAPLGGVIITTLGGAAFGALAGAMYGVAAYAVPFTYLNALSACFLGLALGGGASKSLAAFHIRNVPFAAAAGSVIFLSAYMSHWFFYLAVYGMTKLSEAPAMLEMARQLCENPGEAWDGVKFVNDLGWSLTGSSGNEGAAVSGGPLWAIWSAEAVLIGYLSISAPIAQARKPYSERRGMWMDSIDLPKPVAFIENAAGFKEALARGDYSALMTPIESASSGKEPRSARYASVSIYSDSWEPYISVRNVTVRAKKENKNISAKYVVKYLKTPAETSLKIKDALS